VALVALVAGIATPARAQEAGFDILEFVVDGNTTLPGIEIEKAVYPHLGYRKSIADVQAARAALEKVYQDAGYLTVTVDVPPQEVKNGIVRLKVVDGVVKKVVVTGNRYHSRDYIRAQLPSIAPGTVPFFPAAQKELTAFNQVPGRSVTPVLRPGEQRGEVEMELRVQDERPFHARVEVDNRQAPNTEPLRLQGSVRYDNLWGRDHSASLIYLVAPENRSQVSALSANYLFRPTGGNTLMALYGIRARSNVATLGSSTVVGNADILGARVIHPLPGTERLYHTASVGLDYTNSIQDVTLGPGASLGSNVGYTTLTGQYSATKRGDKGVTRGSLTTEMALRGALAGNTDQEFARRRFRATANFVTLRAELSREQNLKRGAVGYARVIGHAASAPLINTEQFIATGADNVRGYYEAEILGDEGWLATAELRTPSLVGETAGGGADELIVLGFVDAGSVRLKSPLPGQAAVQTPWSTGIGMRYRRKPDLAASVELGFPMEDAIVTKAGTTRVHFRLAYDF
jgi:hemolysin activation/secretion protein